jgi:hypothetical protein
MSTNIRQKNEDFITDYAAKNERVSMPHSGTMGCDPEIFIRGKEAVFPAWLMLPSKLKVGQQNELYLKGTSGERAYAFWDGVQAELVVPPATCLQTLSGNIHAGLNQLHNKIQGFRDTMRLVPDSVVKVGAKRMAEATDEQAALQCDPSENIYGMAGQAIPDTRAMRYRFAGGHIHFGIGPANRKNGLIERYVRMLDRMLGVWAVGVAAQYDKPLRRKYYGLAGQYRLPSHGLEYRTLSNFWLIDPAVYHATFEMARAAIGMVWSNLDQYWIGDDEETTEVINKMDVQEARKIVRRNEAFIKLAVNHKFPNQLGCSNGNGRVMMAINRDGSSYVSPDTAGSRITARSHEDCVQGLIDVAMEGMESVIDDTDVAKNWAIRAAGGERWTLQASQWDSRMAAKPSNLPKWQARYDELLGDYKKPVPPAQSTATARY